MGLDQILLQYGGLGVLAVLFGVVIKWLLKHVDSLVKTNEAIANKFDETINNHLGENTKALVEIKTAVCELRRDLRNLRKLNGNNIKVGGTD